MRKICDCFGNELREGDNVAWMLPNGIKLLASVIGSLPIGATREHDGKERLGKLILSVALPINAPPGENARLGDIVKTFDPQAQNLVEAVLAN